MPGRRHAPSGPGAEVVLLNKPWGVLCQFSPDGSGKPTLADFVPVADVYPAGRLDADSEGLVVLTADGALQARVANPRHRLAKVYWAQVEGVPEPAALTSLRRGVALPDFTAAPAGVEVIAEPAQLWPVVSPNGVPTKVLDKDLSAANLKKLNELADTEKCTVNQIVSKLIRHYRRNA